MKVSTRTPDVLFSIQQPDGSHETIINTIPNPLASAVKAKSSQWPPIPAGPGLRSHPSLHSSRTGLLLFEQAHHAPASRPLPGMLFLQKLTWLPHLLLCSAPTSPQRCRPLLVSLHSLYHHLTIMGSRGFGLSSSSAGCPWRN